MSLDIVREVSKFKIRHLPDSQIRVRIGNHTGPCCAGKGLNFSVTLQVRDTTLARLSNDNEEVFTLLYTCVRVYMYMCVYALVVRESVKVDVRCV